MKQLDIIYNQLEVVVNNQIESYIQPIGYNALDLSIDLQSNRANVSKTLNELWKQNRIIKIGGRPTLFIPMSILEQSYPGIFFATYYTNYSDFEDALTKDIVVDEPDIIQTHLLNSEQQQLSMVLSFPVNGYPPIIMFEYGLNPVDFVYQVYSHLVNQKVFSKQFKFEHIDCFIDYEFLEQLILANPHEKSNKNTNTLFFINNVHSLPTEKIRQLDSFLNSLKNSPSKNFENSRFVLGAATKSEFKFLDSISYTIKTIPFEELSILDKLQFIINTFKNLSKKLNQDIRIQRELFKALCINELETNYFVIEKDISNALIKSHHRSQKENRSYSNLLWSDFSFPLIHKNIPKHTPLNIIDSYFDDVIQFNANQTSKLDYIYNQPIVHELVNLILKTNFETTESIDTFLNEYIQRIRTAKTYELQALTIHSGYSKFQNSKLQGNEQNIGLDFLTTQLNLLEVENFSADNIEYLYQQYNDLYNQDHAYDVALLLLIDSRHNVSTYTKILESYSIPSKLISIRNPLSIEELSIELNQFEPFNNVVIVTDINIYQNLETLLFNVVPQNVISYYPLSIPLIEELIDKIEKQTTLNELRKERYKQTDNISLRLDNNDEDSFVQNLTSKYLTPTLTFLDANKAVNQLYPSLTNILNKLKLSHSKQFVVKYLVHVTFLIERCIKKEYLEYSNLNKSLKENVKLFHIIEKELLTVEESFGINIPLSEIAYIVDIFTS